ncbi:oxidoreductase [Actinokineospora sp. NPDC004072]
MTDAEITATVADFAAAARNAIDAGFDGVELHGANGYLIQQFLAENTNRRTDAWGGSVAGRIRFAVEATRAVADAIGAHRVGLRLSPGSTYNDIAEESPDITYPALVAELAPLGLAYLHVVERDRELALRLRKSFPGAFILNPHTGDRPTGHPEVDLVADGVADIVSFGALFLANPDLPARLARGGPFNEPDPSTYYGGGTRGYLDYPALA